jgi:acyl carrier protein
METKNLQVTMPNTSVSNQAAPKGDAITKIPTTAEIQDWIVSYLADLLEVDEDEIDVTIPFDRYGLDSSAAVGMTGDLEDWLETEIDPTLLYDYPTVEALVKHLGSELKAKN